MPVVSGRGVVAETLRSKAAVLRDRWSGKLGAMLFRPSSKAMKVAVSRPERLPVQGELSLDQIKVVRNDLSDADLEVVAAKPLAVPLSMASARPAERSAGAGRAGAAWGRVSGLFRVGKA